MLLQIFLGTLQLLNKDNYYPYCFIFSQKLSDSRAITLLMEKWLGRVHGLEDQVCSLAQQLTSANSEIQAAIHECQHWKAIAQK